MNTDTDIWFAFARTFGMLFVVLGFFLLAFYLFRRFSGLGGAKGSKQLIQVLSVHHIAPKEKLVLVSVAGEVMLIGVTPSNISRLGSCDLDLDQVSALENTGSKFSDFLGRILKPNLKTQESSGTDRSRDNG
ncbi:MAG: flagellar biosynthetic protein FliO [Desulfobacter sp.]|nr:MAG: flagellar biosynthetic protein FliO [Desulfobacter sp.]